MIAMAVLAAGGLLTVEAMTTTNTADARPSTSDVGRFGSSINWVEWGGVNQQLPNSTFTGTTTQDIGGQIVTTTCRVTNQTSRQQDQSRPFLQAWRSGTYFGDGLDDLYNIGGTGTNNQIVAGLHNSANDNTNPTRQFNLIEFDVNCSSTLQSTGATVPLAGLVIADAETSSAGEYVAGQSPTGTWRIIDRYRAPSSCMISSTAVRTSDNRLQLGNDTPGTAPGTSFCSEGGPMAVAFLEGSTSLRASVYGGSAIAIGVVIAADYADAPASYGEAAHLTSYSFSGGDIPLNTPTRVNEPSFTLGSASQPPVRLGSAVDPEAAAPFTVDASGDDVEGAGAYGPADDEQAWTSPLSIPGRVGDSYSAVVECSPAGTPVAGWIDWNVDGDFLDANERSQTATCMGGNASMNWVIPPSVVGQVTGASTFVRVRTAQDAAQLAQPTGQATSGEVEDYQMTLDLGPTLEVTKNLPDRVRAGDQFAVTIGTGDTVVATSSTTGTNTSTSTRRRIVEPGVSYTVSESVVAGASTLEDYQPAIACVNSVTGASVTPTGSAPSWTLPPIAQTDQLVCTITNVGNAPSISLQKSASPVNDLEGNGPDAGDTVTYAFVATNTGNTALTDVSLTETTFSGTGALDVVCPPSAALLPAGASVPCSATYVLTQADVDAGAVTNTATATGAPPGTLPPPVSAPSTAQVDIAGTAAVSLVKTATPSTVSTAGQSVTYAFTVTNTGNRTLDDVTVTEDAFSGAGDLSAITCPSTGVLSVSASVVCTATYTTTQSDIDAGTVTNSASVSATPVGTDDIVTADDTAVVTANALSSLSLVASASPGDAESFVLGEDITYAYVVTNTGQTMLTNVDIEQVEFTGGGPLGEVVCPPEAAALAPQAQVVCVAKYTIVQADIDAGQLRHTAVAVADSPSVQIESRASTAVLPGGVTAGATPTPSASAPRPDGLPSTGASVPLAALATALMLILLGAGTRIFARRRRSS